MLRRVERYGPVVGAALSAVIAWLNIPLWAVALTDKGEHLSNALGPVFDLATFSAGSLFAIYVLALSKAEGFLGRIFNTTTFRLFHGYVANAIALSVILSLWTAGYMVVGMGDLSQSLTLFMAAAWVGATTWSFLSIARVVLIFLMMVGKQGGPLRGKFTGQTSRT